mmetsp:Transcript_67932/g.176469  ORF Transcript_67932/g.176469 Transcript_67932/m.176469 type:complete len:349 (-) Transcript_67932:505-1551(-)
MSEAQQCRTRFRAISSMAMHPCTRRRSSAFAWANVQRKKRSWLRCRFAGNAIALVSKQSTGPRPAGKTGRRRRGLQLWPKATLCFFNASNLNLLNIATASSAYMGSAILQPPAQCGTSATKLMQAAWVSRAPLPFLAGTRHILSTNLLPATKVTTTFAKSGMQELEDGMYTDSTGILQAVAAGAQHVTSLLNDRDGLLQLFANTDKGPNADRCFLKKTYFHIFKTTRREVEATLKHFTCLKLPKTSGTSFPHPNLKAPYLISFCFGTIETKTAENVFAGVRGGEHVKLQVLFVESSLDLGPILVPELSESSDLEWHPYAALLTEISVAMEASYNHKALQELADVFTSP